VIFVGGGVISLEFGHVYPTFSYDIRYMLGARVKPQSHSAALWISKPTGISFKPQSWRK